MAGPLLSSGLMVSVLQDWTGGFNNFPRVLWHREVRESSSPVIPGDPHLLYLATLMFSTAPPHVIAPALTPCPSHTPTHPHKHKCTNTHTLTCHAALLFASILRFPKAFLCRDISALMKETEFSNAKTTLKQTGYNTIALERLWSCSSALAGNRACFSTFGFHFAWNLNYALFSWIHLQSVLNGNNILFAQQKKPALANLLQTKQIWDFWLNGGAICLSPMPRNQLSQLGLEIKCIAECDCKQREREKEWNKKKALKTLWRTIFLQVDDKYLAPAVAWEHRGPCRCQITHEP